MRKRCFIRINNKEFMIFKLVYIYYFLYLLCIINEIYLFGRKDDIWLYVCFYFYFK